jgi:hypothetical protein
MEHDPLWRTRWLARAALVALALLLPLFLVMPTRAAQPQAANWSARQISTPGSLSGKPAIVADRLGTVHVFWSEKTETGGGMKYARGSAGEWSVRQLMPELAERIAGQVDETGKLHLAWTGARGLRYSSVALDRADRVEAWSRPVSLGEGQAHHLELLGDPGGVLHLAYTSVLDGASAGWVVRYLRSTDGGRSWPLEATFASPPDTAIFSPDLELDEHGVLHLIWSLVPKTNYYGGLGVYYARSADAGQSWSTAVRVDEPDQNAPGLGAWNASIKAFGSSDLHLVWHAHVHAGRRYHQRSFDGGRSWSTPVPIWGSFVAQTGPNPMMVDSAGTLFLFSAGTFDWSLPKGVFSAYWTGSGWSNPEPVDQTNVDPHWLDLALTDGNRLHAVWIDIAGRDRNGWYASGQTSGPYLPPQPYSSASSPTAVPTAATKLGQRASLKPALETPERTVPRAAAAVGASHTEALTSHPQFALMVGVLLAAFPIVIVVAVRMLRLRRG